jgi:hypothetical protein
MLQVTIRNEAQDHRVLHVDMAAEGTGQPDGVDRGEFQLVHQQPHAGIQRGLGKLDRAHIVLGDRNQRLAFADHIAERAARLHHARAALGE